MVMILGVEVVGKVVIWDQGKVEVCDLRLRIWLMLGLCIMFNFKIF